MPRFSRSQPRRRARRYTGTLALLVVDNGPLREMAWARVQLARKRLTRATEELHRHEQQDEPAYRSWMHATCPTLISEIRDLAMKCQAKNAVISRVEQQAWFEGKTPAAVWQARKRNESLEEEFLPGFDADEPEDDDSDDEDAEIDEELDQLVEAMLRDAGIDPLSEAAEEFRDMARRKHHQARAEQRAGASAEAKEIYRRLVQRLHPDRGGDWSDRREALWHEVQRAWHAQDVDWLSRLEAEIEIATETLDARSPVGRLHAALKELESARRDTERKLRRYRGEPAWRFTLTKRTKDEVARLAASLREERDYLLRALASLEATIAHWEKPLGQARAKQQGRRVPRSALSAARRET